MIKTRQFQLSQQPLIQIRSGIALATSPKDLGFGEPWPENHLQEFSLENHREN
jgi:hypothetical protein